ncbi:MAG: carbohydrate binding family 9 domain-containing protein [Acidobacteria bacterium]|nr:carbohydrate binding family 9 domain-containing protein [Acidobacteriota bacterium]
MKLHRFTLSVVLFCVAIAAGRGASASPQSQQTALPPIDGTASPVPPAVVSRDAAGRVTIRAVRIDRPLKVDGRLDEEFYQQIPAIGGFIQQVPREGEPATERTDVWVLFDSKNLYVAARCYDSHPERMVLGEMRRDGTGVTQSENFAVVIDTFHDLRNGFWFQTNPSGAIRDQTIIDEAQNQDWNTIVDVDSALFEGGWTTEFAIPFKSLRYSGSGPQTWGINLRRNVRWKNEVSSVSLIPAAYGLSGLSRLSTAATLVGLETPADSMNLELKPYVLSSVTTDRTAAVPIDNDFTGNAGFDFKYGLTRSLIADLTVNTDFAQVEEDVQQVNLTRFNLFFPEKREFFLEGAGLFSFGAPSIGFSPPTTREVPVLFFSRQIGLSRGQSVPVVAGARLTGKAGAFSIGALNVQTGDKPSAGAVPTNFSVLRLKRDLLRRSNIGMILTRRTPNIGKDGSNLVAGVDTNLQFYQYVTINAYYAKTKTPSLIGDDASYRGRFDYGADRYGLALEHLLVGSRFNPQVGFIRRSDFRRNYALLRVSPRPRSRVIRKLTWQASLDRITDADRTVVQNREAKASFGVELHNSDQWNTDYIRYYEYLPRDFTVVRGVVAPKGGYSYQDVKTSYVLGQQRQVSGTLALSLGTLYGGTKTEASYSGRIRVTTRLVMEPSVTLNWVDLPYGTFTTRLITSRFIVTPTPRLLVSSLIQFNAADHSLTSSIRLRWEYSPRSELFAVYTDGRNQSPAGVPQLLSRALAVKVTRLLRF